MKRKGKHFTPLRDNPLVLLPVNLKLSQKFLTTKLKEREKERIIKEEMLTRK